MSAENREKLIIPDAQEFAEILQQGTEAMGISCGSSVLNQLIRFQQLLLKWNKTYNLTSVRDPLQVLGLHLLDSLSVSSYLFGESVLDVGTGGGLPGIPLAMIHPQKSFVLLDSNAKKIRFLRQVILELKLENVKVVQERVECYQVEGSFDTIVTRAFADITKIISCTHHLLGAKGCILAMKGKRGDNDRQQDDYSTQVIPLSIPGIDAQRHLVILNRRD